MNWSHSAHFLGIYKRKPNDKDAKLKFTECKKIVQQRKIEKSNGIRKIQNYKKVL